MSRCGDPAFWDGAAKREEAEEFLLTIRAMYALGGEPSTRRLVASVCEPHLRDLLMDRLGAARPRVPADREAFLAEFAEALGRSQ